jgi:small subunit ribosomal protein S25e
VVFLAERKGSRKVRKKFGKIREHFPYERALLISDEVQKSMEKEIPRMPVVTPTFIAEKYGIRVSIAKKVLEEMVSKGIIEKRFKSGRVAIYVPLEKAKKTEEKEKTT